MRPIAHFRILAAAIVLLALAVPQATALAGSITATGTTLHTSEGAVFTGMVASFTDSDIGVTAGNFTTMIAWGDGAASAGTIAASSSGFNVNGTHTYTEEGTYPLSITIHDIADSTNTPVGSTAQVADAPLIATSTSMEMLNLGGTITDAIDPGSGPHIAATTAITRSANISYPDFTTISDLNVTIWVVHPAINELRIRLIPPPTSGVPPVTLLENGTDSTGNSTGAGASGANLVSTTFDQEAPQSISDNTGGAASSGHFRPEQASLAGVNTLTLAQISGIWTLELTDFRSGNSGALQGWSLSLTSGNCAGMLTAGQLGIVASFTDTNPNGIASDFTASITWAANDTMPGIVTGSNGSFYVLGVHRAGLYRISILIADRGGSTTTATGSVTITGATLYLPLICSI